MQGPALVSPKRREDVLTLQGNGTAKDLYEGGSSRWNDGRERREVVFRIRSCKLAPSEKEEGTKFKGPKESVKLANPRRSDRQEQSLTRAKDAWK